MRWSIWILCLLAIILMVSPTLAVQSPTPGGPGSPGATLTKIDGDLTYPELLPLAKDPDKVSLDEATGVYFESYEGIEWYNIAIIRPGKRNANVRSGPGTNFDRADKVNTGEVYKCLSQQDRWLEILKDGQPVWVHDSIARFKKRGGHKPVTKYRYVRLPKKPPIWENWEPQQLLVGGVVVLVILFIAIGSYRSARGRRRDKKSRDHRDAITLGNRRTD